MQRGNHERIWAFMIRSWLIRLGRDEVLLVFAFDTYRGGFDPLSPKRRAERFHGGACPGEWGAGVDAIEFQRAL